MQLTLLLVNFFLITIISREYGAETYGEYASSKSLSVLIGTATVMSLALVSTKYLAQKNENSKLLFSNSAFIKSAEKKLASLTSQSSIRANRKFPSMRSAPLKFTWSICAL